MMFKWLYWYATFMFLFFLPGLSIIMLVLYGLYAIVAMVSGPLTIPNARPVAESVPSATKDTENSEVTPAFDPASSKGIAASIAEEARLLELERHQQKDEQQMIAQNNERRHSETASSFASQFESDSWQDRLEAEARG